MSNEAAIAPGLTYALPDDSLPKRAMINTIERLSGRRQLQRAYDAVEGEDWDQYSVWEHALRHLDISLQYDRDRLKSVPAQGPLILIANHPFGIVDGLALCLLASTLRREYCALVHSALCREKRLSPYLLPVEFAPTRAAQLCSIESRRQALALLQRSGALVIFPAAAISTARNPFGRAVDWEWNPVLGRLVHMSQATVLPIFFHGQNSWLFHLASAINPTLRLSLILREVRRSMGRSLTFEIGTPLSYECLASFKSRQELTHHLRAVTYALADRPSHERPTDNVYTVHITR